MSITRCLNADLWSKDKCYESDACVSSRDSLVAICNLQLRPNAKKVFSSLGSLKDPIFPMFFEKRGIIEY